MNMRRIRLHARLLNEEKEPAGPCRCPECGGCLLPVLGRLRCTLCGSVRPKEGTAAGAKSPSRKMPVLSRKVGEKTVLGGGIVVTVLEVLGGRVRIGVQAPGDLRILRAEVVCRPEAEGGSPPAGPRVVAANAS
jgi:carbon storage regulator CsrA